MKRLLALAFALFATTAHAENVTLQNHAFAIGKGPGVSGYTALLCGSGQIAIGSAADPTCRAISGDATVSSGGVLTLSTVNGNVGTFGSAAQCSAFTANGKGLITAASAVTCTPGLGSITGLGTGVASALALNVGSAGAPVVFNGALGTPSSGTIATGMTLGPVTMTFGGDATGDLHYRNAGGIMTRLPIGASASVLTVSGGLPAWAAATGGATWLGRQTFCASGCTATGGVYTPTAGTGQIWARCVGGGGGSGGAATTAAGQNAISGAGGGGGYAEGRFTSSFSGITVTIGIGGTAGSAGNNAGGAGGTTTFGGLMTLGGGGAGAGGAAAVPGGWVNGNSGGSASGGDIQVTGGTSDSALYVLAAVVKSAGGGSSPFGYGGQPAAINTATPGVAGNGHGAGASGAAVAASNTQQAGAAGTGGLCVVDEYK